jgi:hypothetical protein
MTPTLLLAMLHYRHKSVSPPSTLYSVPFPLHAPPQPQFPPPTSPLHAQPPRLISTVPAIEFNRLSEREKEECIITFSLPLKWADRDAFDCSGVNFLVNAALLAISQ